MFHWNNFLIFQILETCHFENQMSKQNSHMHAEIQLKQKCNGFISDSDLNHMFSS